MAVMTANSPDRIVVVLEAIEKALLYTFQLSNKDYRKIQAAMSEAAFIRALEQDGFTITAIPDAQTAEAIERIRARHDWTLLHQPTNRIGYCAEPDGISATYCETGILLAGLR